MRIYCSVHHEKEATSLCNKDGFLCNQEHSKCTCDGKISISPFLKFTSNIVAEAEMEKGLKIEERNNLPTFKNHVKNNAIIKASKNKRKYVIGFGILLVFALISYKCCVSSGFISIYTQEGAEYFKTLFFKNHLSVMSYESIKNCIFGSTECNFRSMDLTNGQVISVAFFIIMLKPSITKLDFSSNNINDEGAFAIAFAAQSLQNLTDFNFENNIITQTGARNLAEMLANKNLLTKINFNRNNLGAEGMQYIASSLANKSLTEIHFKDCRIEDKGLLYLCEAIKNSTQLKYLSLGSNHITFKGTAYLKNALENKDSLEHISLGDNKLEDKGAKNIGDMLISKKHIKRVIMPDITIYSDGFISIIDALMDKHDIEEVDGYTRWTYQATRRVQLLIAKLANFKNYSQIRK